MSTATTPTLNKLLSTYQLGTITLSNRIVMAPMTRSRAIGNVPNALMANYYHQRASVGLIITEGTSPSPNGLGYARIPGLYNQEQVKGWSLVADAVHKAGGKIFVQLMHTGRVGHPDNLPTGAEIIAPSALSSGGQMWTDSTMSTQAEPTPRALETAEIDAVIAEYVNSAKLAIEAGLDGVELHAANGYLLEQFLSPISNHRTDNYGGSAENRNRFVLEVAKAVADEIGTDRTGIRISPYGVFNGLGSFEGIDDQFLTLVKGLSDLGLVYLHLVNHEAMGAPALPANLTSDLRAAFKQTFILSGGYDAERAEKDLSADKGDLVAFGRPLVGNPDFVARVKGGHTLAAFDPNLLYTHDEKGYTDYPTLEV